MSLKTKIKAFFTAIIFAGLMAQIAFSESPQDKNIWYEEWDEAMFVAKKDKKPMMVDFYTNSCGVCKAMDETTFLEPEIIGRFERDWIGIKVNCHKLDMKGTYKGKIMNYGEISQFFKVSYVPTFLFFDKKGEPVQVVIGYLEKDELGFFLDYMRDEVYKKNIKFKDYKKNQIKNK